MPVHKLLHRDRRTASPIMPVSSPPPTVAVSLTASPSPVSKYPRFGKRGAPQAFPSKLYEILEGENPDIVGWTATGRGFEVRDHARLSSEVLGRFFKQDKFSSFQRQLNLYGFRKITKGSESGSYQHPHFRRGERTTLLTIRRSTKASPGRVAVPVSPASTGAGTPPTAVPLSNSSNASTTNGADNTKQPRSATPSPPPAAVSRGVLPWPRPPTIVTGDGLQQQQQQLQSSGPREVSPDASTNSSNSVKTAPAADRQQQGGSSSESYAGSATATTTTGQGHSPTAQQKRQWADAADAAEQEPAKAPSALDQSDAEVVGLLQRMAKEAQDSPSRKRAALASQHWEGTRVQAVTCPSSLQHPQQPHFQIPRPAPAASLAATVGASAGSDEGSQAQQAEFAERLYDILNHERAAAHQQGFFSLGFGADGRAPPGFPQQHQIHRSMNLPSPFATTASVSSSSSSSSHLPLPPCRNDSFESVGSTHRGGGEREGESEVRGRMSEQERQILLARSRSGPSATAEQDRLVLLARSRSGPAGFSRDDEQHHYYHRQQQQQQQRHHDAGFMYDHSPNRSPEGRGGFSFGNNRFASGLPGGSSGALPPLPSLNLEQFNAGGGGGSTVAMAEMRRSPWYGPESSYAPPSSIGNYIN